MKGTQRASNSKHPHPLLAPLGSLLAGLLRLSYLLPLFLASRLGRGLGSLHRQLCVTPRLATIFHTSAIERKALLLEWLLLGPVGFVISAETIMEIFGGRRYRDSLESNDCGKAHDEAGAGGEEEYVFVDLDERYDEKLDAIFYLDARLDPPGWDAGWDPEFCFVTTFEPMRVEGRSTLQPPMMAAWMDASTALISYYGSGEAEEAGVGFEDEPEDHL